MKYKFSILLSLSGVIGMNLFRSNDFTISFIGSCILSVWIGIISAGIVHIFED
jgi:hypothetical protein